MKNILFLTAIMVFLAATNSNSASINLININTISANGIASSDNSIGNILVFGRGSINQLDGITDYVRWSHLLGFNLLEKSGAIDGTLIMRLRNEDNSWLTDTVLGYSDQGRQVVENARTGSYSHNSDADNTNMMEMFLSLNRGFFIDSSELTSCCNSQQVPAAVPETSTMMLLGLLLTMTGFIIRKKTSLSSWRNSKEKY
jgi:hypothetical protein